MTVVAMTGVLGSAVGITVCPALFPDGSGSAGSGGRFSTLAEVLQSGW